MVKFTCRECGAEGETFPSQPRQFCSLSCSARSGWATKTGPMPSKPRRGVEKPCEKCGVPTYRSKGSTRRFCSVECHDQAQRIGQQRPCETCGRGMYVTPSIESKRFCCRACYETQRASSSSIGRTHNGRGVVRDHAGYLRIWEPEHPASMQGRVLEHRWVMEQAIGRFLVTDEHVHHVNGVKDDNRVENLQVMGSQDHRLLTARERVQRSVSEAEELAEYRRRFGPLTEGDA